MRSYQSTLYLESTEVTSKQIAMEGSHPVQLSNTKSWREGFFFHPKLSQGLEDPNLLVATAAGLKQSLQNTDGSGG